MVYDGFGTDGAATNEVQGEVSMNTDGIPASGASDVSMMYPETSTQRGEGDDSDMRSGVVAGLGWSARFSGQDDTPSESADRKGAEGSDGSDLSGQLDNATTSTSGNAAEVLPRELSLHDRVIEASRTDTTLQERHPDWPRVEVLVYETPHGSAIDHARVPELLHGAQVCLYENSTPALTEMLQDTSDGKYSHQLDSVIRGSTMDGKPVAGSVYEPLMRGLDATGIAVGSMDVTTEEFPDRSKLTGPVRLPDDYDEALSALGEAYVEHAKLQADREIAMVAKFEPELERILAERQDLRNKTEIKVVAPIGSYHTAVSEALIARGVPLTSEVETTQWLPDSRIMRRIATEGQMPDRVELAQAYFGHIIKSTLGSVMQSEGMQVSSRRVIAYINKAASAVDVDDVQKFHELTRSEVTTVDDIIEAIDALSLQRGFSPITDTLERFRYTY
jgi:hypothetical protein